MTLYAVAITERDHYELFEAEGGWTWQGKGIFSSQSSKTTPSATEDDARSCAVRSLLRYLNS